MVMANAFLQSGDATDILVAVTKEMSKIAVSSNFLHNTYKCYKKFGKEVSVLFELCFFKLFL